MSDIPPAKYRLCIVAFSPVAQDARVLRQAAYLSEHFQVTVAGFGSNPFLENPLPNVSWFELDTHGTTNPHAERIMRWAVKLGALHPRFYEFYYRQLPYWRYAWHFVQSTRFRVVYCNDVDSLLVGVAARRHSNRYCKLVLDMHEYATRELGETEHWRNVRRPLVTGVLKHYSKQAQGTVTVVESFVDLFRKEFGMKKPIVVHNAPEFVKLPMRAPSDGKVHLIHHGSCLKLRELELMIQMMAHTDERFVLHMMLVGGDKQYVDFLHEEARKVPAGRVIFEQAVRPAEIVTTIMNHDIGVFLLPPVVFNYEHAMPNKFFDFIGAGLGVIIGPSPNMEKMVREKQIGWVARDFKAETMARLLNSLTASDIKVKRAASMKLRETLNAESEMTKLVSLVLKVAQEKPKQA